MSQVTRKVIAESIRNNEFKNARARWQWREILGDYYPLVKPYLREVGGILYEYRTEPWAAMHEVRQWRGTLKIAYSTAESPDDWGDISEDECNLCEIKEEGIYTLKRLAGFISDAGGEDCPLPEYIVTNAESVEFRVSPDFSTVTELRKGKPLKNKTDSLRPLAIAYLSFLIENCGHVVTRDELIKSATQRFNILKKPLPNELRIYDAFRISKTEGKRPVGIYSAFSIKGSWDSNSTYTLPLDRLRRR
jgi:hypothetical protein